MGRFAFLERPDGAGNHGQYFQRGADTEHSRSVALPADRHTQPLCSEIVKRIPAYPARAPYGAVPSGGVLARSWNCQLLKPISQSFGFFRAFYPIGQVFIARVELQRGPELLQRIIVIPRTHVRIAFVCFSVDYAQISFFVFGRYGSFGLVSKLVIVLSGG